MRFHSTHSDFSLSVTQQAVWKAQVWPSKQHPRKKDNSKGKENNPKGIDNNLKGRKDNPKGWPCKQQPRKRTTLRGKKTTPRGKKITFRGTETTLRGRKMAKYVTSKQHSRKKTTPQPNHRKKWPNTKTRNELVAASSTHPHHGTNGLAICAIPTIHTHIVRVMWEASIGTRSRMCCAACWETTLWP